MQLNFVSLCIHIEEPNNCITNLNMDYLILFCHIITRYISTGGIQKSVGKIVKGGYGIRD